MRTNKSRMKEEKLIQYVKVIFRDKFITRVKVIDLQFKDEIIGNREHLILYVLFLSSNFCNEVTL